MGPVLRLGQPRKHLTPPFHEYKKAAKHNARGILIYDRTLEHSNVLFFIEDQRFSYFVKKRR